MIKLLNIFSLKLHRIILVYEVKWQTAKMVEAIITNGNHVLIKLAKLTYFPKKNIQAANLTMFQLVDPTRKQI